MKHYQHPQKELPCALASRITLRVPAATASEKLPFMFSRILCILPKGWGRLPYFKHDIITTLVGDLFVFFKKCEVPVDTF